MFSNSFSGLNYFRYSALSGLGNHVYRVPFVETG